MKEKEYITLHIVFTIILLICGITLVIGGLITERYGFTFIGFIAAIGVGECLSRIKLTQKGD